jgi:hypothetical protein
MGMKYTVHAIAGIRMVWATNHRGQGAAWRNGGRDRWAFMDGIDRLRFEKDLG